MFHLSGILIYYKKIRRGLFLKQREQTNLSTGPLESLLRTFFQSQDVVSCFAKSPSCKGESINRFRFWILQEAMLEVKLNICPQVNFENLKDAIKNTGKIEIIVV